MRALAVALAAIGLLDVLLGFARGWGRAGAIGGAVAATAVGALMVGCSPRASAVLATSVAVEAGLWTAAHTSWRPRLVLAGLAAALAARVVTSGLWFGAGDSLLDRWARELPFGGSLRLDAARLAYVVAALVFLATAGNTLIRLLLGSVPGVAITAEGDLDKALPGGGRVIGSLERVLIFGLAVAGEATAAAVVISAKGILRFAEVRGAERVDRVTEYVLVGSLASYTLAMAFVPLAIP